MGHIKNYHTNLFLMILDSDGSIYFLSDNFRSKLVNGEEISFNSENVFNILEKSMHAEMRSILTKKSKIRNKMFTFKVEKVLFLQCTIFRIDNKIFIAGENLNEVNDFHLIRKIESLAKIGGWVLNVETMTSYWTEQTYQIHDLPVGTPTNAPMGINFYHPDYREKIASYVDLCITKSQSFDDIFKFITEKNKEIWVRASGSPVQDENGRVVQVMGTFQNVDNYVRLSEELEEKTGQLNDVLENSPGMVYQFHLDNKGNMTLPYVSAKTFEIYEIQHEDFEKDPLLMLNMVHESEQEAIKENFLESAEKFEVFEWEGRIVTKSKTIKTVKSTCVPRKNNDGSVTWNGILMDITKEKEMEYELNHQKKLLECSARLASLGEISAGIGHEINTPLAIILLKIDEIREQLSEIGLNEPQIEKNFDYVDEAVNRINSIVRSLKHLSRDQDKNKRKTVRISDEVERSLDLIKELYRNNGIQIVYENSDKNLHVHCPGSHIQQIVLNLISNAKDVLLNSEKPMIRISTKKEGKMVILTVADNGPGIPRDVQDKIFLPFFTTKDVDKGTGIGLAMCYSLIKNVNGNISFDTNDTGTTFKCKFWVVDKEVEDVEQSSMTLGINGGVTDENNTKILLVDDDPTFLGILNKELRSRCFDVYTANSGELGLQMAKENDFDIILSDLKMPEMDGLTLFEEIEKFMLAKKTLKIIMSGDITDENKDRSKKVDVSAWLQKPFEIEKMMECFSKDSK